MTDHENGAEADMEKSSGSKFRVQDTRERSCKVMVDGDLDVHHVGLNLKRWRWSASEYSRAHGGIKHIMISGNRQ